MAKGENLEKPKKGGMVIVIGVGAKPKKDKTAMKKAEGRRAPRRRGSSQDNQRARIHAFKQKLRNDPYHLEQLLEGKGIPIDSFEEHFHDKHGKTLDEAVEDGSVDVPQAIEEAQQIIRGNEGQFRDGKPNPNLARLLERRRIDPDSFQQSLRRHPFMEFQERINLLAERSAQNRAEENRDDERHEPLTAREREIQQLLNAIEEQEQSRHDEANEEDSQFRQERLEAMRDAENNMKRRREKSKRLAEEEGEINYNRMVRVAGKLVPAKIGLKAYHEQARELRERIKQGYYGPTNFNDLNNTRKEEIARKDSHIATAMRALVRDPNDKHAQQLLNHLYENHRIEQLMNRMGYDNFETIYSRAHRADGNTTAGQFGNLSEQEKGDYYEFLERLFSADSRQNPEVQAMRHLGMDDTMTGLGKRPMDLYPGYTVEGRVARTPSTEFNPYTPVAGGRAGLPTPQEEDEEEANKYAKGNPMSMAWALLKGNPDMRDTEGKSLDHPAAMVYDNLAAQIEDPMAFFRENDESVADDMESMRRFNQERLKREKEQAREQMRQTMEFGNEDFSAPYHGIRRMPRPEEEE